MTGDGDSPAWAEFRAWVLAPLPLADLLRIELSASAREFARVEAVELADELMAETEAAAAWDRVAADVVLRDLAETDPGPVRARRRSVSRRPARRRPAVPDVAAMIRRVS